jgi:hypothetical protein
MAQKFTLPKPKIGSANAHETESSGGLRGAANDVKDQISPFGSDFFKQLLGLEEKTDKASHSFKKGEAIDMQPGEAIDFKALKKQKSAEVMHNPNILPGIDYRREIVHGAETINAREKQEMAQTIQEIKNELQRLVSSSAILQAYTWHKLRKLLENIIKTFLSGCLLS